MSGCGCGLSVRVWLRFVCSASVAVTGFRSVPHPLFIMLFYGSLHSESLSGTCCRRSPVRSHDSPDCTCHLSVPAVRQTFRISRPYCCVSASVAYGAFFLCFLSLVCCAAWLWPCVVCGSACSVILFPQESFIPLFAAMNRKNIKKTHSLQEMLFIQHAHLLYLLSSMKQSVLMKHIHILFSGFRHSAAACVAETAVAVCRTGRGHCFYSGDICVS